MYLNKSKNGFGWYSRIVSKDLNTNAEREAYVSFTFKRGCEPNMNDLTDKGGYQGELIFRDTKGQERKVFPVVTEYNGNKRVEFKLLEIEGQPVQNIKREQTNDGTSYTNIKSEDLPFY